MSVHQTPRKLSFWLIASILINMLLIGALGGIVLSGSKTSDASGRSGASPRIGLLSKDAPDADQQAVGEIMRSAYKASKPERIVRKEAREKLATAMGADPYDTDAVRAAFANVREAEADVHQAIHEQLASKMADLTPEQRAGVTRALRHGPRGRRGKRHKELHHKKSDDR